MPEIAVTAATATAAEAAAVADSIVLQSPGQITFDAAGETLTFDGDRIARSGAERIFNRRHLLLPVLHDVRDAIGWLSEGAINEIATSLQVPPAEVYGVASFYELFTFEEPSAPDAIHVCDDTACRVLRALTNSSTNLTLMAATCTQVRVLVCASRRPAYSCSEPASHT